MAQHQSPICGADPQEKPASPSSPPKISAASQRTTTPTAACARTDDHATRTPRSATFMEQAMSDHGSAVYRLALNQTRSPQDAEDVAQDVFLRLLNDRTNFVDGEHLKAWLLRVTVNRCHELRRSAWKRRETTAAHADWRDSARSLADADPTTDPESHTIANLVRNPVWQAMKQLPRVVTTRRASASRRRLLDRPNRPDLPLQRQHGPHAPAPRAQEAPQHPGTERQTTCTHRTQPRRCFP